MSLMKKKKKKKKRRLTANNNWIAKMLPTRLALALRRPLTHWFGNRIIKMFYKTASLIFPGILYDKSKKIQETKIWS